MAVGTLGGGARWLATGLRDEDDSELLETGGGVEVETIPAMGLDTDPVRLDGVEGAESNGDATAATSAEASVEVSCPTYAEEVILESEPW